MVDGALRSFVFGATLAAAVGPIAILIFGYGARGGFRPAAAAGLGAALADLIYALVAFSIGSLLLTGFAQYERPLRTASALVLTLVGVRSVAHALRARGNPSAPAAGAATGRPLATTFLLTLVNPLTIVLFTTFATQLPVRASRMSAIALASSLFCGSLMVQMMFAFSGAAASRYLSSPRWMFVLNLLSGAAISAFGVAALIENVA